MTTRCGSDPADPLAPPTRLAVPPTDGGMIDVEVAPWSRNLWSIVLIVGARHGTCSDIMFVEFWYRVRRCESRTEFAQYGSGESQSIFFFLVTQWKQAFFSLKNWTTRIVETHCSFKTWFVLFGWT